MPKAAQSDAAVFRTEKTLAEGRQKIDDILDSYDQIGVRPLRLVSHCGAAHRLSDLPVILPRMFGSCSASPTVRCG